MTLSEAIDKLADAVPNGHPLVSTRDGGVALLTAAAAELRTLRAEIKDAWDTLGGEWKECDATLGEAIAAELGEYDEANPEALSATVRENQRLRARVAEMERDARLGAVVRDAVGDDDVLLFEYAETIRREYHDCGVAREPAITRVAVVVADALRAEEGGE